MGFTGQTDGPSREDEVIRIPRAMKPSDDILFMARLGKLEGDIKIVMELLLELVEKSREERK